MADFSPELSKLFSNQQREQRNHVHVAMAGKNVRETKTLALQFFDKLQMRGQTLDATEATAVSLEQSSKLFLLEARPWWKRLLYCQCIPKWWFCFF